jgi:hypothetical protein
MTPSPAHKTRAADREAPNVPLFKTWRGVYLFVFGCFVAYVVLLAAFTSNFS